jgi:hypothetical protein
MQILYSRCCGIDVHKNSETACVPIYSGSIEPAVRKRESGMAGAGGPLRLDSSQPISGQEPSRAQDRRAGQSMGRGVVSAWADPAQLRAAARRLAICGI